MKMVKSLILGSAAGLLAIGGAQAADLPVKAKAVEYVKICSLYGAGFYYIPGTDTCLKLGGYLRIDTTFNAGGFQGVPAYNGDPGLGDRARSYYNARAREQIDIDTRTATEYGVVRTYGMLDVTSNSTDGPGNGTPGVEQVFLQFAGFTMGRSLSAYATPWSGYIANNSNALFGADNYNTTGAKNIQYTAQFGSGFSATIGLDDPNELSRTNILNTSVALSAVGTPTNAYAGNHMPDVSGNVKVDQAWGLFQLSGQLHEVTATYNALSATAGLLPTSAASGYPGTKYGGAVMGALQIKNIPTGPGDTITMSGTYTKGDTKQVISSAGASPSFLMLKGSTLGFGTTTDAIYTPVGTFAGQTDGGLHLTTAYGMQAAFAHNWNANWATSIYGTQSWVKYDTTAAAGYCAAYALAIVAQGPGYSCNPNYTVTQIGINTGWTPVKNLTFSAEAQWFRLGTSMGGTATLAPGAPYGAGVYNFKSQNTVELQLRAQRNF